MEHLKVIASALFDLFSDKTHREAMQLIYRWFYQ